MNTVPSGFRARRIAFVALIAALLGATAVLAKPLRVIAIGDSITQGGKRGVKEYTYRWPLARMLTDEGVATDFIGTRRGGVDPDATWPGSWDNNHEGYYGATSAYVRDRLRENLSKLAPPDVALIDLGTNDSVWSVATTIIEPVEEIVQMLRARNPRVTIFVARLPASALRRLVLRRHIVTMAGRLSTPQSPMVVVAQDADWNANANDPAGDTFDGVHPNLRGQRKMAEQWLAAMRPFLASLTAATEVADRSVDPTRAR